MGCTPAGTYSVGSVICSPGRVSVTTFTSVVPLLHPSTNPNISRTPIIPEKNSLFFMLSSLLKCLYIQRENVFSPKAFEKREERIKMKEGRGKRRERNFAPLSRRTRTREREELKQYKNYVLVKGSVYILVKLSE